MKASLLMLLVAFSACAEKKDDAKNFVSSSVEAKQNKTLSSSDCPIGETRNWQATLTNLNSRGVEKPRAQYMLSISGEVDLPATGYEFSWEMGIADRALPPGQRIKLTATPPKQANSHASTKLISFRQVVPYNAYRFVSIYCGSQLLTKLQGLRASN